MSEQGDMPSAEGYAVVPLLEELRIEAAIVPHRRGVLYGLAADEIERLRDALSEGSSKWVPISEPPTKTGSYLVWIAARVSGDVVELRGRVQIERYTADDGAPKDYFGEVGWKTYRSELAAQTHWMPLPEAPK